jgi:transcriptional regulator with XRE-family HTH domain
MSRIIGWQDGPKIRQLRERTGLSVATFAERNGIVRQHLSLIELNRKGAGLDTLVRIAKGLGVPVDFILRDELADDPGSEAVAA